MKWPIIDEREIENPAEPTHRADANGTYPLIQPKEGQSSTLKQRIASTVRAAQAQRNLELKQASDRARDERQDILDKARSALLHVLSDDVLNTVIGKHAGLGELSTGAIKITKHGVELIRSGGTAASHMVGDKLDVRFDGAVRQAGQQMSSPEIQERLAELQEQGLKIDVSHEPATQGLLIAFDYSKALN
jgi:hypothetical protein